MAGRRVTGRRLGLDETGFMDADGHLDPVRGVQLDQDV
jgi:hypothetical protein